MRWSRWSTIQNFTIATSIDIDGQHAAEDVGDELTDEGVRADLEEVTAVLAQLGIVGVVGQRVSPWGSQQSLTSMRTITMMPPKLVAVRWRGPS
jgi:hypothetical protein